MTCENCAIEKSDLDHKCTSLAPRGEKSSITWGSGQWAVASLKTMHANVFLSDQHKCSPTTPARFLVNFSDFFFIPPVSALTPVHTRSTSQTSIHSSNDSSMGFDELNISNTTTNRLDASLSANYYFYRVADLGWLSVTGPS